MSKTFVVSLTVAIEKFLEDSNKTLTQSGSLFRLDRSGAERGVYAKLKDMLEKRTPNLPPDLQHERYRDFESFFGDGRVELPIGASAFYLSKILDMTIGPKKTRHLWIFNRFGDDVLMRRSMTMDQFYAYRFMQEAANVRDKEAVT